MGSRKNEVNGQWLMELVEGRQRLLETAKVAVDMGHSPPDGIWPWIASE